MSIGIIFQHFWLDQTSELEQNVYRNTNKLIEDLPSSVEVMTLGITVDTILTPIKNKFSSIVEYKEMDASKIVLQKWIQDKGINEIYIAGLHFNCCVMNCTTVLKDIANELDLGWGNTFNVKVIEECTISLHENEKEPCKLEDTKLYMDCSLVKPWLVKSDIVLERVK
jgi:hypothetical protein